MIDTHVHILEPGQFTYKWTEAFPALQGRFGVSDYLAAAAGSGIEAGVFMEVDCEEPVDEADHFCRLADEADSVLHAVVASARPESPDFASHLDKMAHPRLTGIRRVLHTQPDDLSRARLFRENVRALGLRGLSFDLCVQQRQLPIALELVRDCPGTTFILDHCGVPDIAGNEAPSGEGFIAWNRDILSLAAEPNVIGKISGLTAYASAAQRTTEALQPYADAMLQAFGPDRLVWGGDWPVVNLGSGLRGWADLSRRLLAGLGHEDQAKIFSETAKKVYRLA